MIVQLLLYTRKDCCLCEEMKQLIDQVSQSYRVIVREVDVDASADLQAKYGGEIPVLFINGRKAFKYRVTARELEKRLRSESEAIY
jgi:glutaredoxin